MEKQVRLYAPLRGQTGYAKAGRGLLSALLSVGYEVQAIEAERQEVHSGTANGITRSVQPLKTLSGLDGFLVDEITTAESVSLPPDVPLILLQPPNGLSVNIEESVGPRIGFSMIEASDIPDTWKAHLRNVDTLLSPSTYCRTEFTGMLPVHDALRSNGLWTLPLCVDERVWYPDSVQERGDGVPSFLFFAVFSTCERKQWRALIQAFEEEFTGEDVGLILLPSRPKEVKELAGWCSRTGAWIDVASEPWSDATLRKMYSSVDCYVLPSAEGFGNTFIESAMCGTPFIALKGGGTNSLLSLAEGECWGIEADYGPLAGQLPQMYHSNALFARPASIEAIKHTMRRAYRHLSGRTKNAEQVRFDVMAHYSRKSVGDLLDRHIARVGRCHEGSQHAFKDSLLKQTETSGVNHVAFVVTTFNHFEHTKKCIESIEQNVDNAAIVVVDDGSTDETLEWLRARKTCVIECSSGNLSKNRNMGVSYLKNIGFFGHVVFLDNDTEFRPKTWSTLSSILDVMPKVGVLSPVKVLADGNTHNIGNFVLVDGTTRDSHLSRHVVHCNYVEGACMVVRFPLWQNIDSDEQFEFYYNDVDYCFQARFTHGYDVVATDLTSILHDAHTSNGNRVGEFDNSRKLFVRKWRDRI